MHLHRVETSRAELFSEGTEELIRSIAESDIYSIIGGGDTVAAVKPLGVSEDITFISTAGGGMMDFLVNGTTPGIIALEKSSSK